MTSLSGTGSPASPAPASPALGSPAGGFATVGEAEHWIFAIEPAPEMACTHLVRSPRPHVAVTLDVIQGGRAVLFPGSDRLTGTVTVAEVVEFSAVDRVEILGGGPAEPAALLDTTDYVRPLWQDGQLVLTVMPAVGGRLIPFETRNPTPCCAAH